MNKKMTSIVLVMLSLFAIINNAWGRGNEQPKTISMANDVTVTKNYLPEKESDFDKVIKSLKNKERQ